MILVQAVDPQSSSIEIGTRILQQQTVEERNSSNAKSQTTPTANDGVSRTDRSNGRWYEMPSGHGVVMQAEVAFQFSRQHWNDSTNAVNSKALRVDH